MTDFTRKELDKLISYSVKLGRTADADYWRSVDAAQQATACGSDDEGYCLTCGGDWNYCRHDSATDHRGEVGDGPTTTNDPARPGSNAAERFAQLAQQHPVRSDWRELNIRMRSRGYDPTVPGEYEKYQADYPEDTAPEHASMDVQP